MASILFLLFSFLLLHGAQAEIICENLPIGLCSFSIAFSGKRCVLENNVKDNGNMEYLCNSSEIFVKDMNEWIESDKCLNACGLHRKTVGISSDSLLEPHFLARLCSDSCYKNCPNIVDLYHNLAIGEGVFLANLCEVNSSKMPRRVMTTVAADGPISMAEAPTPI
ncbi:hypothetical protein Hdeb2414_s0010g00358891 [Helianthus debilis subsp. tardiflorus]